LLSVKGVELVGPLPAQVQNYIIQIAGVSATAVQGVSSARFSEIPDDAGECALIREKGKEPSR